ncbi:MAG: hypothetical protein HY959_13365 [Ignavibacteriae bacterium]|nr:hypothetical protein [Ignavibacteriota bacterium]
MKEIGAILLVLGLTGIYYFQFEFDTSINMESGKSSYSKPINPQDKDGNTGLNQDRNNYTYISIGVSIIGAVMLVAGIRKNRAGGIRP